jgi:predicted porin
MKSSSGTKVVALEDGAYLRTRWGVKGVEDLGDGYTAKFTLEGGINADNGSSAVNGILFDRQSWIGFGTPKAGEFRVGRQNGTIFVRGGAIDFTARTLGSMINSFGVPSRYDNDVSWISPRWSNVQLEGHISLPESPVGNHPIVYQVGIDWSTDKFTLGYAGLRGGRRPMRSSTTTSPTTTSTPTGNTARARSTSHTCTATTARPQAASTTPARSSATSAATTRARTPTSTTTTTSGRSRPTTT